LAAYDASFTIERDRLCVTFSFTTIHRGLSCGGF
jgi:hypothetical protein